MRTTAVRRTALAASVMSLALLATACGGAEEKGGKADAAAPGAEDGGATKAAVKALTSAELEKLSLEQGDAAGQKIAKTTSADRAGEGDVTADKKECEPISSALYGVKRGAPIGDAARRVTQEPVKDKDASPEEQLAAAFDITSTLVTLNSYEGDGAAKSIAELRDAVAACSGGFVMTTKGEKQNLAEVTEEKVSGGEEAAAWNVLFDADGSKVPFKLVIIRQGATVATFATMDFGAMATKKTESDLPTELIDAQLKKLG
ncbi:hypothetical protein [Streptomyces nitrosporeus]|uniref:hypothetical protein n=1 Tax=Streptomyces nitrosporeus TaxID=28894 RepID=UPI0033172FCE